MVDVVAAVALIPIPAPALELVPCLGLALLGVVAGRPTRPPPDDEPAQHVTPDTDSPWAPPAERP